MLEANKIYVRDALNRIVTLRDVDFDKLGSACLVPACSRQISRIKHLLGIGGPRTNRRSERNAEQTHISRWVVCSFL